MQTEDETNAALAMIAAEAAEKSRQKRSTTAPPTMADLLRQTTGISPEELECLRNVRWLHIVHGHEQWSIQVDWMARAFGVAVADAVAGVIANGMMQLLWVDIREAVLLADPKFAPGDIAFAEFIPRKFFDPRDLCVRFPHHEIGVA